MAKKEASDLHLKPMRPPLLRIKGRLIPLNADTLQPKDLEEMLLAILTPAQKDRLERNQSVDVGYGLTGVARFRCNIFVQRGSYAAVFRRIPFKLPSITELNLPEVLESFVHLQKGLVLITGPTGSGKSTSLAGVMRSIIEKRPVHIVTIEDPIEFLFADGKAAVSQREVSTDSPSFGEALKNMGADAGDLDGDGLPDLVVANYENEMNAFYRNLGSGVFDDLSASSGFGPPAVNFVGFGLNLLDADDDGDLDAFIANGHIFEKPQRQGTTYAERPFLMWNDGAGRFRERGCGAVFTQQQVGRGSAVADYDNDGDPDVAVSNSGGPLQLLRNDGGKNRWVGIQLVGRKSNRQGIGARLVAETPSGKKRTRLVQAGNSYLSSSDPRVLFGLGEEDSIRRLTIFWPSGIVQTVDGLSAGRYHRVEETEAAPKP